MADPWDITVSYDCLLSVDGQLLLGVQLTSNRSVLCMYYTFFLFLEKSLHYGCLFVYFPDCQASWLCRT